MVHRLLSLQLIAVCVHCPLAPLHASAVHALLSLQLIAVWAQPVTALQLSAVHRLLSSQLMAPPGWHTPPPQTSPLVQALPSLHDAVFGLPMQAPSAGLHTSSVHGLLSLHTFALPGRQAPAAEQVSVMVHSLPSSHPVPAGRERVAQEVTFTGSQARNLQLS